MKKTIYSVLVVVAMVLSLWMCACTSGTNNNSTDDGKNEQNNLTITKIAITAPAKVDAGKSVQVAVKLTFSDGKTINNASFLSYGDLTLVITSGNQYCQVVDDNISVSDNAPDKLSVSFYVKNKNVKSNTLQLSVSNQKAVLQTQLQEYEDQKLELEKDIQSLTSQYNTTKAQADSLYSQYQQYATYLKNNGCATAYGDYKHICADVNRHKAMYAEWKEVATQESRLSRTIWDKQKELEDVKTKIKMIQDEIKKL